MKRKILGKRVLCIALSAVLALSLAGCGDQTNTTISGGEIQPETQANAVGDPAKEKVTIDDFYQYVNEDWLKDNYLAEWEISCGRGDAYNDEIYTQMLELLNSSKASDYSEDEPMYKLLKYYEQLSDSEQRNILAINRIKEMTDYIQGIKTVNEFVNIMSDEDYSLFNNICSFSYELNTSGNNAPAIYPVPLLGIYSKVTADERKIIDSGYSNMLLHLGYSEEDAARIADNAGKMDDLIRDFYVSSSWYYDGYNEDLWKKVDCVVDLEKICADLGYVMSTDFERFIIIFVPEGYLDWLNETLTSENLPMLRDFYTVCLVDKLAGCGNRAMLDDAEAALRELGGAAPYNTDEDEDLYPIGQFLMCDEGLFASYYADNYISDSQKKQVEELAADIVDSYVEVIKGIEWLDIRQRERINIKVKKTDFYIGRLDEFNTLDDVAVKENVVDTTLEILKSNRRYGQQCLYKGTRIVPGYENMYYPNAFYFSKENAVVISNGYFANEDLWQNNSYEQRLATIGRVIAHELGHEFDSNSIGLKSTGVYDDNWNGFWEQYYASFDPVYYYYDGMETEGGYTVNGGRVCNESYADMVALKVLMNIMAKLDNPDYDAFFTAYAADQVCILRPQYEEFLLSHDTHVTSRERVNGVLAQCNEFYETYNVDKGSKYYVEPSARIKILELAE